MNRSLAGIVSMLFCVGIFTFIYMQHQILVKEVQSIEKSAAAVRSTVAQDLKQGSKPAVSGIAYQIDPANDPLAPVVKKPAAATAPAASSPAATSQKPVYEIPMDSPVLIQ